MGLANECDQLFNACASFPSSSPETQAEEPEPAERLIRPKALHNVTQRLIDRLGSRSSDVLERIGYIYGAAAAHRGGDYDSGGHWARGIPWLCGRGPDSDPSRTRGAQRERLARV